MANNFYGATAISGGGSGALDAIDGTSLATGDGAYVITSTGFFVYYMNASSGAAASSPDVVSPLTSAGNKRWLLQGIGNFYLNDTNGSNSLLLKWNEDDTVNRVLNFKVNSGNRTLDLSEDLTLADGYNLTFTVEDAASSVVLDNINFEVENTDGTQRTIKITSSKAGNTTLSLNENFTIGDGHDISMTAEDAAAAVVLDNANLEIENLDATQRNIKITSSKAGDTTVTLQEDFTVGDGAPVTITAEDAAGAITLDNVSLEVEDNVGSGKTIKIANATDDANRTITLSEDLTVLNGSAAKMQFASPATLTVEGDSAVNQDLTTDSVPTFASAHLTNVSSGNIPRMASAATGFTDSPLTVTGSNVESSGKMKATAFVSGTITVTAAGPTDDLDVSGVNLVLVDSSSNSVTIGGLVGGVSGQQISIVRTSALNNVKLEHDEGGGNQDVYLADGSDETISTQYGGWVLACDGSNWFEKTVGSASSGGTGDLSMERDMYQDLLGGSAYLNCTWDGFTSEDLVDTVNTTMDFNLGATRYDFTIGEVVQSDDLYDSVVSTTITECMVSMDYTDSGTPTLEATADGTNWETVTNNVIHTFTDTGTTLKLRFTAGGTGYVSSWAIFYNSDTGSAYGSSVRKYITFNYEGQCQDEDTIIDGFYFNNSVAIDKITLISRVAPTGANLTVDLLKDGAEQSAIATLTDAATYEVTAITTQVFAVTERFGLIIKSVGSTEPGNSLTLVIHYYDRS